jgi:carbonic anhydrase
MKIFSSGGQLLEYTEKNWPITCSSGKRNSPVDFPSLNNGNYVKSNSYIQLLSSNYTILQNETFRFYNNYKFFVNVTSLPGVLMVSKNGIKYAYNLIDIHLHLSSEHTFEGNQQDLEIHMVHSKNKDYLLNSGVLYDPDVENIYLVVGVVFKAAGTTKNSAIEKFNFGKNATIDNLDMNEYIKNAKNFYHYLGGLTTPNCDEVVNWVVIDKIETMTVDQYSVIQDFVHEHYPKGNARGARPRNGRTFYYVNNTSNYIPISLGTVADKNETNFSLIIVAMAALFLLFFFRKKFDIV